jgi:CHASE2 domain-containing sensor protein
MGKGRRPPKPRPPFWRRLYAASPVIAGSIFLTLIYGNADLFRKLEKIALAFEMRVRAPAGDSRVVIVRITDEDYQKYFGGKSPLDPARVHDIIDKIATAGPTVIAVDLDTSAEAFQSFQPAPDWPPVIWARNATYSNVREKYLLSGVLGRDTRLVPSGLVTLKLDSDGTIRRYARFYDTNVGPVPSLPEEVLKKFPGYERRAPATPDFKEEFLINYPGPAESEYFFRIPVWQLYEMSDQGRLGEGNLFENKMVILGGDYAVQDEHDTPVGWMTGSQILASIIETERRGGGRQPIGTVAVVLLAVVDSIVLLFLIHILGLGRTLLLSIVIIPVLAALLSLLFFGSVGYSGTFLIILIAVLAQQVYEKGKDYFKKWREQAAEEIK